MAKTFQEVYTPFSKMSFTPDVPSSALAPSEYNAGKNVETDTRGIRSVFGDEEIFDSIPDTAGPAGKVIFVTSGYRANNIFWYVVCVLSNTNEGRWYAINAGNIINITPGYDAITNPTAFLPNYDENIPITDSWNGNVLILNDSKNPPMYLLPGYVGDPSDLQQYSNNPAGPGFIWNYDVTYSSLTCGFMHLYSTPNVGSILIAGNLKAVDAISSLVSEFPTTVRWSQAFGLNQVPATWAPTALNVANELEVPVRGPVIDGFPLGANFYVCSYWDTVVFSPINYQSTSAPILGVRLLTQGRGLLNENCWANADTVVYGLDARDIWAFDGNNFRSLGNQRVKNFFYANLNPDYAERTFVINNTEKNQFEIYYADYDTPDGWPNKMLGYRYDLDVFNPPRDVSSASHATEAPIFRNGAYAVASRTVTYSRAVTDSKLVQKDQGTTFLNSNPIDSQFRRDNLQLLPNYSQQLLLHRILPAVVNIDTEGLQIPGVGNVTVTVGGCNSVGSAPTDKTPVVMPIATNNPWAQINQNAFRVNSLEVSNSSTTDTWELAGITWQYTPTEDSR